MSGATFQTNFPDPGVTPLSPSAKALSKIWDITSLEDLKNNNLKPLVPITIWYRMDDKGVFQHNHLELGFDDKVKHPTPKVPEQAKTWKNSKWAKAYANIREREGQAALIINKGPITPM